jgi:KDO2-lipid IV(A) lauroyltransferase
VPSRDLRTGGRWTPLQSAKNALVRSAIRVLIALGDRLPEAWLLALGSAAGRWAARVLPSRRELVERNFTRVAGSDVPPALVRSCFESAGRNLALCLLARRADVRVLERVEVGHETRAVLDRALAVGRGVVFVSAHLGPFEWVAAAIAELGYRASVVVRESYDPALDPIVDAHRVARGLDVIHRGDRHSGVRIVRALRRGRAVGLLPDLGGRVESVGVHFLSARVDVPVGPARLAHRTGAAIVVGTLEPLGPDRHRLRLESVEAGPDERATTQRIMARLEAAIRRTPEQWLGLAKAWDSGPAFPENRDGR